MFNRLRKYLLQESGPFTCKVEGNTIVTAEPPKKDISEPIVSFVETVKKDRKRFKVSSQRNSANFDEWRKIEITTNYRVEDLATKEIYTVEELEETRYWYGSPRTVTIKYKLTSTDVQWCTPDELEYVITELTQFYGGLALRKSKRYDQIQFRRTRDMNILKEKERNRLINIYCKE